MDNLTHLTAAQAVEALKYHQIRSIDLVNGVLERIQCENSALNANVTLDSESARRQAMAADAAMQQRNLLSPLHGIPIAIKDSFETTGMRTVSGCDLSFRFIDFCLEG